MKFLIVDDHKEFRDVLKQYLRLPEDEVIELETTFNVIETYCNRQPDVVLMDIRISPMDGLKTTTLLKNSFPDARVIIVTQYNDAKFRERAFEVGAEEFITKINLSPLRVMIEKLRNTINIK